MLDFPGKMIKTWTCFLNYSKPYQCFFDIHYQYFKFGAFANINGYCQYWILVSHL